MQFVRWQLVLDFFLGRDLLAWFSFHFAFKWVFVRCSLRPYGFFIFIFIVLVIAIEYISSLINNEAD